MTFHEFHQILLENSGVTNRIIDNKLDTIPSTNKSFFFLPYQSKSDPFIRASTLITGPAIMSLIALECSVAAVFFAIKSIVDLVTLNVNDASKDAGFFGIFLIATGATLLAVLINPITNLIDLIGGGVSSLSPNNSEQSSVAL
jgi:hypothetical protein